MGPFRRRILLNAFRLFDLLLVIVSFGLTTVVIWDGSKPVSLTDFFAMRVKVENFVIFFILLVVWHLIFSSLGLYDSRRLSTRRSEIVDVVHATSLGILSTGLFAVVFPIRMVTPPFLLVFWTIVTSTVVSSRLVIRYGLADIRRRGRNLRFVLVVGTNSRALEYARKIEARSELGYRIIGFADDEWPGMEEFSKSGYRLACDLDKILAFTRSNVVDEVVMALPVRSLYHQASQIAAICEEQGITIRLLSSIFNLKMSRSREDEFEGDSLITVSTGTRDGWPLVVKRLLDICASLILLILLSPLILVVAVLIKLTSPGPIFFLQDRVGLNKRKFQTYKFRTMVSDAEQRLAELEELNEVTGPVFKIKNDPRITPLGRWLRRTSIDELPQLLNVLKGEMSLVGPRPLPLRDYEGFDQDWQRRRFSVRPGITCLWQINGRSSVPFEKWMELDMEYVDKWSIWLDLKILLRTIPAVLRGTGAA